jgi:ribosome biogenesis GTPase / thiamine phosphate phosphatase
VTAAEHTGCVIESFGRRVVVARPDGTPVPCKVRGRKLEVVVGDEVRIEPGATDEDWTVVERHDRRNVLRRSDSRGLDEAIAANLDQLAVVVSPRPPSDPFIADRYLAGAAYAGIPALVIANKQDLPAVDRELDFLGPLEQAGIPILRVSARTGDSLDQLRSVLADRRTLFAGQSGVGKSSLFNVLSGLDLRATRTLSDASGEGRHTTVSSAILRLPWGELVDTPGVRDYAPPVVAQRAVQEGYPEITRLSGGCRFQDCLHQREPNCAVRAAVDQSDIVERRYESYRRLLNLMRQLDERRGWRT